MADAPTTLTSRVSRKWTIRMVLISVVLIAFGLWGLYDATRAYPARGALAAEWFEFQYLEAFKQTRSPLDHRAGVKDPVAERDRLRAIKAEKGQLDPADQALVEWVDALELIGKASGPAATAIPRDDFRGTRVDDARTRLAELQRTFTTGSGDKIEAPSALTRWDIPVQWLITVLGVGIGLYIAVLIVRVTSKRFTFDESTLTLGLPGGATLTPGDIEDFDKRRWHKFYVSLKIKPGHPTLAGKAVELDLLRYEPLEDWVLRMEKAAFPPKQGDIPTAVDAGSGANP
jgi:hypothetical protein